MSELIERLRDQLGDKVVVTDPDLLAPWLTDWRGRWSGKAKALLQPGNVDDVRTIVAAANEARVPLVPQGGNSSMVGGATPDDSGAAMILSLRRMTAVRSVDRGARQVVAEAGIVLEALGERLVREGLRFPLDLGARGNATVGGLVSTNAGGTEVLRHGTMGEMVVGLEVVLAHGEILDTLSPLKKDNRGPRLDRLFVGGEGQFGIVTAARLQCVALPRDRATAWLGVRDPGAALAMLHFLEERSDAIEGFELVPADALHAAIATFDLRPPLSGEHAWHVLVEAKGEREEGSLRREMEGLLADALERGMIEDATLARSEEQSAALWHIRHSLSDAEKRHFGMANSHDISVPVEVMPGFIERAREEIEREWPGVSVSGYGHLGDGNIHLHVRAMDRASDEWRASEGRDIERRVHDLVSAHGGSISAEHGIGQMKRDELQRLGEKAQLHMLRELKRALDPNGIFNPGKLI